MSIPLVNDRVQLECNSLLAISNSEVMLTRDRKIFDVPCSSGVYGLVEGECSS